MESMPAILIPGFYEGESKVFFKNHIKFNSYDGKKNNCSLYKKKPK